MTAAEADLRLGAVLDRMAQAAGAWLGSLTPAQRRKAWFGFPAPEERTRWYYVPTEQGGLPLAELDPAQQRLAHQLLASGLSRPGYVLAATVMGLENVLDAAEGWRTPYPGRPAPSRGRDPLLYYLSVFGEPGGPAWGWRVGGHHLALNYTIVGGQVAASPLFVGANPATSPLVGPDVLRPLAAEEELGRELLGALAPDQRAQAVLSPVPPPDVVQANRPFVEAGALPKPRQELFGVPLPEPAVRLLATREAEHRAWLGAADERLAAVGYQPTPSGLAAARMTPPQRALLERLVGQYLGRLPDAVAALQRRRAAGPALEAPHFAWAGGGEPGRPHYYRVQGPRLLIEYDNTQDGANHAHSVWRDPAGDFGADLLPQPG